MIVHDTRKRNFSQKTKPICCKYVASPLFMSTLKETKAYSKAAACRFPDKLMPVVDDCKAEIRAAKNYIRAFPRERRGFFSSQT